MDSWSGSVPDGVWLMLARRTHDRFDRRAGPARLQAKNTSPQDRGVTKGGTSLLRRGNDGGETSRNQPFA